MSQNVNPPWLREESFEPLHTAENGLDAKVSTPTNSGMDLRRTQMIFWVMKIITMLLCFLMAATAVIGIGEYSQCCLLSCYLTF